MITRISTQDRPQGLAVAVAMIGLGYSRFKAFLMAAATGAVEVVGDVLDAAAVTVSGRLLPLGLTFATGAIFHVVSYEIGPETHRNGPKNSHRDRATAGLILGLILEMFLDVTLG